VNPGFPSPSDLLYILVFFSSYEFKLPPFLCIIYGCSSLFWTAFPFAINEWSLLSSPMTLFSIFCSYTSSGYNINDGLFWKLLWNEKFSRNCLSVFQFFYVSSGWNYRCMMQANYFWPLESSALMEFEKMWCQVTNQLGGQITSETIPVMFGRYFPNMLYSSIHCSYLI
jgi:hypothetical protein